MIYAWTCQASEVIRNAEISEQYKSLFGISKVILETFDEVKIGHMVVEKGLSLIGAEYGCLYIMNSDTNKLELTVTKGLLNKELENEVIIGEGFIGKLIEEGKTKYISPVIIELGFIKTIGILLHS